MPSGIKIWDASGNVVFDTTVKAGRVLGQVSTGTANGSVTNADFSQGVGWFTVAPVATGLGTYVPTVTLSGTTVSWSFWSAVPKCPCIITYGVY